MNDNPYRPPTAQVADLDLTSATTRPPLVNVATALLCVSVGVGFVNTFAQSQRLTSPFIVAALFVLAVLGGFFYKIWQGRNWARIVFLGMFVVGAPLSLPQLPAMFEQDPVAAVVFAFQSVVQFVALYLVFLTPARHWFTARKAVSG